MKVLRFYDDRTIVLFKLFIEGNHNKMLSKLIPRYYDRIECCSIDDDSKKYIMLYFSADNKSGIEEKEPAIKSDAAWELMDKCEYHVFLDTLWGKDKLPKKEKAYKFGTRKYPNELNENLKDVKVKTLTMYSTTSEAAVRKQNEIMEEVNEEKIKNREYFPKMMPFVKIIYGDQDNNLEYFKNPLKQK